MLNTIKTIRVKRSDCTELRLNQRKELLAFLLFRTQYIANDSCLSTEVENFI